MSNQTLGILLGGVVPAVFLALFNIFMKYSTRHDTSGFYFMLFVGLSVSIICGALILITGDRAITLHGFGFAVGSGVLWVTSISLIFYALSKYNTPLSKISPIFNANTMLVVLISLVVFSEWQEVNLPKTIAATLMIIGGSILISQ